MIYTMKPLRFLNHGQHSRVRATKMNEAKRLSLFVHGDRCHYCGGEWQVFDHVIPRSKGGDNSASNLVPCCHSCNSSKGTKDYEDFVLIIQSEKIAWEMSISMAEEAL